MKNDAKILIIRLSALGDTIHTIPLAVSLKNAYPDCKIGWVVEDKAQQFVKNNPVVDKCYILPRRKWKKRGFSIKNLIEFLVIMRKIRRDGYDIVLDTQQLFKSAVIMAFLNIKRKITLDDGREFSGIFANEIIKTGRKQFDRNYHVVKRNMEFAKYLGANSEIIDFKLPPVLEKSSNTVDMLLKNLDKDKKTIALAPATTWENKHWKREYWEKLISEYAGKVNIIMTGSSADQELCQKIVVGSESKNIINICSKTSLLELAEVFKRCDIVISPDSGSAHIAWAIQKPSVITIFTSTSPLRTGPFGDKYYSIGPNIPCAPCMKKKSKCKNGKNKCTMLITPDEIIKIVNNILQSL